MKYLASKIGVVASLVGLFLSSCSKPVSINNVGGSLQATKAYKISGGQSIFTDIDLGPGGEIYTNGLTNAAIPETGPTTGVLAKLNPLDGSLNWTGRSSFLFYGGLDAYLGTAVAVGQIGNVYAGGQVGNDGFIRAFDANNAKQKWGRSVRFTDTPIESLAVYTKSDKEEYVYAISNNYSTGTWYELNDKGTLLKSYTFKSTDLCDAADVELRQIVVDKDGNSYVSGLFALKFGAFCEDYLNAAGFFVAKIDNSGNLQWVKPYTNYENGEIFFQRNEFGNLTILNAGNSSYIYVAARRDKGGSNVIYKLDTRNGAEVGHKDILGTSLLDIATNRYVNTDKLFVFGFNYSVYGVPTPEITELDSDLNYLDNDVYYGFLPSKLAVNRIAVNSLDEVYLTGSDIDKGDLFVAKIDTKTDKITW